MQIVQVAALRNPPTGSLPKERRKDQCHTSSLEWTSLGPLIKYPSKTKKEMKAHIMLYASSLTQGIYTWLCCRTKVLRNSCTVEAFHSKERAPKDISDNGKTFLAAAKWMRRTRQQ